MMRTTRHIRTLLGTLSVMIVMLWPAYALSQNESEQAGDEAFELGWYKTALAHYKTAITMSAQNTDLLYKMAESARLANDYPAAIRYYQRVRTSGNANKYPDTDYLLATMYKCNGTPDSALFYYKAYVQSFPHNTYFEQRARQEVTACSLILNDSIDHMRRKYQVFHEGKGVNTENSESGAIKVGDSIVLFSRLDEIFTAPSENSLFETFVLQQIYQSKIGKNGRYAQSKLNTWGLNSKKSHSGNVAYDEVNKCVYLTYGDPNSFSEILSQIYVSYYRNGKWTTPKKLGRNINLPNYTSTQPAVAHKDGTTLLFYASNRPGGSGGMDIWYSVVDGEKFSPSVNLGTPVNTVGDEITPFYCDATGELYFSSDYHYGYGGFDIFCSEGFRDQWTKPENLGGKMNSPANDLYFTVNTNDTLSGFLTTNRKGSYFIADNTCCNDIYSWRRIPDTIPEQPKIDTLPRDTIIITQKSARSLLPVTLYFHNDEPDPRSQNVTTTKTYSDAYTNYLSMKQTYLSKREHFESQDQEHDNKQKLNTFFDSILPYSYADLDSLMRIIRKDLQNGRHIRLLVKGYASPLATEKYNFILSKRRISSFLNELLAYDNGIIAKYIQNPNLGGSLQIEELALGSSKAGKNVSSDAKNQSKSVYSPEAIAERRIEIVDYQYTDEENKSRLQLSSGTVKLGSIPRDTSMTVYVSLPIVGGKKMIVNYMHVASSNARIVQNSETTANGYLTFQLKINTFDINSSAPLFIPLTIRVNNENSTQTIFLEYQVKQ